MPWELIIAGLLILANALFVAVEFSVTRVRPTQAQEALREGRAGARSTVYAIEHIDAYLSACQLGITISSLALGAIGEHAFHDLLEPVFGAATTVAGIGIASGLAFLIITVLHVVLGELSPKSLAIAKTMPIVLALAPPMRVFYTATRPLVDLLNGMGNTVLKPFGVPPASEAGHQPHSEAELRELLQESSREGMIEHEEEEMSEAALVFGDSEAREVMRPREAVEFVLTTDSPEEIASRALEAGHTRFPVCEPEGQLDAAVGTINAKDLLRLVSDDGADLDITETLRPIDHYPASARIDEVLREMRDHRLHLGLVDDEGGSVIGLLTMEDILEELVGEIEDEFDASAER